MEAASLVVGRKRKVRVRAVVLWSPRGTGKTSLLRHLAKREEYAQSYKRGRLLMIDANILQVYTGEDSEELLCAIIIWHLLRLFDGYHVGEVAFQALDFGTVIGLQSDPGVEDELKFWARSLSTVDKAFQRWKEFTALNAEECPLLIFMDQTELLTRDRAGESSLGGMHSGFTGLCSRLPQKMACFFVGTLNFMDQAPSEEYTRLIVHQVPALVPLSLEAAKKMMKDWKGKQYEDAVFEQMHLFSGVPRLLQWAFEAQGELSTAHFALNEMSRCFKDSYASAAALFKEPAVALSLVLCSAVRWPVEDARGARAPGTNNTWSEIFNGAAFPAGNTVLVPRVRCAFKIFLDDLLPDPLTLVTKPGPTDRGEPPTGEMCGECIGCTVSPSLHGQQLDR